MNGINNLIKSLQNFTSHIESLERRIELLEEKEDKPEEKFREPSPRLPAPSLVDIIEEVTNTDIVWKDNWQAPYREMVKARQPDIYDPQTQFRGGSGKCWIEDGVMNLSGGQPRLYINIDIQNVEVSVDYKRIGKDGKGWSGGTIGVRSHPEGHSKMPHLAHTYYLRLKHEGKVDIYREIDHGTGGGSGIRRIIKSVKYKWETDKWHKLKFRCFNIGNDSVKLEGYVDNKLVVDHIDKNKKMYDARGVVFIRNTEVEQAQYKNMNIKIIKIGI